MKKRKKRNDYDLFEKEIDDYDLPKEEEIFKYGEPGEWNCLDSEQREKIRKMYIRDYRNHYRKEKEIERTNTANIYFALFVFAVYYNMEAYGLPETFLYFLLHLVYLFLRFLGYIAIWYTIQHFYNWYVIGETKKERIWQTIPVGLVFAYIALFIYTHIH